MQIIEASLGIVIVATVTQGVHSCQGAGCGEDFAIGVVGVRSNGVSSGVNQVEHVTLGVGDVVILGAVVGQAERVAAGIVGNGLAYIPGGLSPPGLLFWRLQIPKGVVYRQTHLFWTNGRLQKVPNSKELGIHMTSSKEP